MKSIAYRWIFFAVWFLALVGPVLAQGVLPPSPFPPGCNPTLPPNGQAVPTGQYSNLPPCNVSAFMALLRRFINWGTLIVVALAVIFILYGGVLMMFSGGSEERFRNGRKVIQIALTGVIIAFLAWLIVNSVYLVLTQRGVNNQ